MDECRQIKGLDNREGDWPDNLYQEMCPKRYVDERQRLLIVALLWAIMQFERPDNSESGKASWTCVLYCPRYCHVTA